MCSTKRDIIGQKYGRLTVTGLSHKDMRNEWYWRCICDCGQQSIVSGYKLRSGHTKSCGCLRNEIRAEGLHKSHGKTNSRLYTIWCNMKRRCYTSSNYEYHVYGGKGVRICDDWLNDFSVFYQWALKNGYDDNLSIDRIDVNGDYCPENCRWATYGEQALNRTDNHLITAFGRTQTIKEWSVESGIKYDTIERRVNAYRWDAERAVSEPTRRKRTAVSI